MFLLFVDFASIGISTCCVLASVCKRRGLVIALDLVKNGFGISPGLVLALVWY